MALEQAPIDAPGTRSPLRDELSMLLLELGVAGFAAAAAALLAVSR